MVARGKYVRGDAEKTWRSMALKLVRFGRYAGRTAAFVTMKA